MLPTCARGMKKLTLFPWLVFLTLFLLPVVAGAASDPCPAQECPAEEEPSTCSLYLAPSSLSNAGLGLYTAVNLPHGTTVLGDKQDAVVAIEDHFKTFPYRGQQRFLSWLRYIWPKDVDALYPTYRASPATPKIPLSFYMDSGLSSARGLQFYNAHGERVNAFAPGMASLINSNSSLANLVQQNNAFVTTDVIAAGSELLFDYGTNWHKRHNRRTNSPKEYDSSEAWNDFLQQERFQSERDMTQGHGKKYRDEQDVRREMKRILEESADELNAETDNEAEENYEDNEEEEDIEDEDEEDEEDIEDEEEEDEDEEEEEAPEAHKMPPVDPNKIDWLQKNGLCVDNIQAGPSTLPEAGQGAFATRIMRKGSLIAPAPLLVLKRDDLVIYAAHLDRDMYDDVLDFDKVQGLELLLNYCFGHANSSLLLVPYSPVVNFINHQGTAPNAEIRWPKGKALLGDPNDWLHLHPLEVLDKSGELMMEFVALHDIQPGEEIFIDYGREWEEAWRKHEADLESTNNFRHEIGVPSGFFPDGWKVRSLKYGLAPRTAPMKPGEVVQMRWAHNGKPVAENAYIVGLPQDFSVRTREYSDLLGATSLYEQLLKTRVLKGNEWFTIDGGELGVWTVSTYSGNDVHDIGSWDEAARVSWLRFLGQNGFDTVLDGIGKYFGYKHLTCFFNFFVGLAKSSKINTMHCDMYGTGNSGFNILWPYILVNGSKPELLIQSDDANIVLPVHYKYDVAFALGDYAYHMTNPVDYGDTGRMRIVVGTYCSQIDESNFLMHKYLNAGDEPVPFLGELDRIFNEIHWGQGHSLPK